MYILEKLYIYIYMEEKANYYGQVGWTNRVSFNRDIKGDVKI